MKILIALLATIICALLKPSAIYAVPIWDGWYSDCSYTCEGAKPADCRNGPSNTDGGGCGEACGGGDPWSRYEAKCKNFSPPDQDEACEYAWVKLGDLVCSTGNKCVAGELGLRSGQCNCGYSQSIYKACCIGATAVACQNYAIQDGIYPNEGVCPGAQVDCPSGNAALCCSGSPTNTPGPSPTPGGGGRRDMTTNRPD